MNLRVKIFIVVILLLIASLIIVVDRVSGKVDPEKISSGSLQNFIMKVNEPAKEQVNKLLQKIEGEKPQSEEKPPKDNYVPTEKENSEITEEYTITDKLQIYSVQNGDTFYSLSKRFYGTSKYANKLFEYNKHLVKKPENLKVGMKLKIPDKSVLEKEEEFVRKIK